MLSLAASLSLGLRMGIQNISIEIGRCHLMMICATHQSESAEAGRLHGVNCAHQWPQICIGALVCMVGTIICQEAEPGHWQWATGRLSLSWVPPVSARVPNQHALTHATMASVMC